MKKNILLKSIIIFLTLTIYSCGNSETKKTELIYENGNQKVEIRILNGNDYLEYEKPTNMDFVLTNIEPHNFMVAGVGITAINSKNGIMKTKVNVPKNYLDTDTLKVRVRFGEEINDNHEFLIPIRKAE